MIFAFYSFKGGVGRTMAAANVAFTLAQQGLNVLLVDFDLEAPGLDNYFPDRSQAILGSEGVIDLIASYKHAVLGRATDALSLGDLEAAAVPIWPQTNGVQLRLIPVGRRADDATMRGYASAVHALNWTDFYERWEGELYFRWLRNELGRMADVTIVDCQSGINDASMICCGQLADVVVLFCAANRQQISGCKIMLTKFNDLRLTEARGSRLETIVVPTRIEAAEASLQEKARVEFSESFADHLPAGLTSDDVWQAQLPYVPYWSYVRDLAVRCDQTGHLGAAYRRIGSLLMRLRSRDAVGAPQR